MRVGPLIRHKDGSWRNCSAEFAGRATMDHREKPILVPRGEYTERKPVEAELARALERPCRHHAPSRIPVEQFPHDIHSE